VGLRAQAPVEAGLALEPWRQLAHARIPSQPELGRRVGEGAQVAVYMVALVRRASGSTAPLTVTSTVRDRDYQRLLVGRNQEATRGYSLHTTGWSFDVLRRYASRGQAAAFQFALERLQALDLIAWAREPQAIHITASGDAARLEKLIRE
jgi:hypothetical protein